MRTLLVTFYCFAWCCTTAFGAGEEPGGSGENVNCEWCETLERRQNEWYENRQKEMTKKNKTREAKGKPKKDTQVLQSGRKFAALSGTTENDFWAPEILASNRGGDRFYTNGLKFDVLYRSERQPGWAGWFGTRLTEFWVGGEGKAANWVSTLGWESGQYFFTPENIEVEELIEDDRPYAAWLFGGVRFVIQNRFSRKTFTDKRTGEIERMPGSWSHDFELQGGWLGPAAGGEFVQTQFHKLIDSAKPLGWDNQLSNELGLNVIYRGQKRFSYRSIMDVVPHFGFALGNIQTYASGGATLRLGWNITSFPRFSSSLTVRPTRLGCSCRPKIEAYIFAGYDGRLLARNIYLDGNTFVDSHSVNKESFVYDRRIGVSFRFKNLRVNYIVVSRSREFSPDPEGSDRGGVHDFGSLTVGMEYAF